jgi:hypothetical protein
MDPAAGWFPEEDFDLKVFASQEDGGIILLSKLLRETFLHSPAAAV